MKSIIQVTTCTQCVAIVVKCFKYASEISAANYPEINISGDIALIFIYILSIWVQMIKRINNGHAVREKTDNLG
jgi:ABC-type arginine/histidine transport system permease subunit